MKLTRTAALAAALALCVAGSAAAQLGAPNPDLNRDGTVSLAEYKTSQAEALFGRFDKNRDGKITRAEFAGLESMAKRFGGERGAKRVNAVWTADTDRDGTIARSEIEARAAVRFKGADADHDGALDKAELKALRAQIEQET